MNINEVSMGGISSNSKITKTSERKAENESTNAFEEAGKTSQIEITGEDGHIPAKDSKIAKALEEATAQEEEQTPFQEGYEEGKELRQEAEDKALGALGKAAGVIAPGLLAAATGGVSFVAPVVAKAVEDNKETIEKAAGKVVGVLEPVILGTLTTGAVIDSDTLEEGAQVASEIIDKTVDIAKGGVIDLVEDIKDKLSDSDTEYKTGFGEMSKEDWETAKKLQAQMREYAEHPTVDIGDVTKL